MYHWIDLEKICWNKKKIVSNGYPMQSYQLSKIILEKVRSNYWSKVLITLKQKWKGFYPVFYVLNLESWQLVLGCPFEAKKKKKNSFA